MTAPDFSARKLNVLARAVTEVVNFPAVAEIKAGCEAEHAACELIEQSHDAMIQRCSEAVDIFNRIEDERTRSALNASPADGRDLPEDVVEAVSDILREFGADENAVYADYAKGIIERLSAPKGRG
jgi:transcription elongation factor Elf1